MNLNMTRNVVPDIIICSIVVGTIGCMYILASFIRLLLGGQGSHFTLSQLIDQHAIEYGWLLKLFVNCFGYACIFIPGILIYQYTKKINYLDGKSMGTTVGTANVTPISNGWIPSIVRFCLSGLETDHRIDSTLGLNKLLSNSPTREYILYAYCFTGLMASYLTWGLLQEKIITQEYLNDTGNKKFFRDSQFLVFTNRSLAFFVASLYLILKPAGRHRAPLYKYSFASFSNIMSAWFQYEALKFVNFPTQVLAKSCKIIPVMLMGKVVSRAKYEFYEYLTAILISLGMVFFLMGSANGSSNSSITTMTGVLLLTLYMTFDSFTSNWQGDLFKTYQMTSIQMMCGVNLFSTLFTAASLAFQGGFMDSMAFASEHPKFIVDCIILSISSAIGQLFIFYTIATFGPVAFTIMMTIRQGVAILLSCLVYGHHISVVGIIGVGVVFLAIFIRVYCNQRLKSIRRKAEIARTQRIGV